jgi:PAS domain S-box-containing protein
MPTLVNTNLFINGFLLSVIVILIVLIFLISRKKSDEIDNIGEHQPSVIVSEQKYRDLFENANDAIFILDSDLNYKDVNKKAVELLGYSREELLHLNVKDLIPPEQHPKSDKEFEKLHRKGSYEKFVGKTRTKDGRWLDVEVNSSAIFENGKIIGSRDIVRNITERKKTEKEKEALISELQKALDEITTLKGILPFCSFCKKIRNDKGYWERVDIYIRDHSEADISHSICPECAKRHYAEFEHKPENQ